MIKKTEATELSKMKLWLSAMNIQYVTEHRFDRTRKFRFDIALLDHRIAIEYEGIFSAKSRHTSVTGYTNDTEKYNLATLKNWRILRYTAMNYKDMITDVQKLIKLIEDK